MVLALRADALVRSDVGSHVINKQGRAVLLTYKILSIHLRDFSVWDLSVQIATAASEYEGQIAFTHQ